MNWHVIDLNPAFPIGSEAKISYVIRIVLHIERFFPIELSILQAEKVKLLTLQSPFFSN